MSGPQVEMGQWLRLTGGATGKAAGGSPWVPVVVLGVVAFALASAGAALVAALVWLVVALVVLVAAVAVLVLVLRHRAEAWRPFGSDARITTGPRLTEGHKCSVCAPVYVPAAALVAGPGGELLGLCLAHRASAESIVRRALPPGGLR